MEITLQVLVGILALMGSGVGVYVGLKIATAETKKDIGHILEALKELNMDVRDLEKGFNEHRMGSFHIQPDLITRIERSVEDIKVANDSAHLKLGEKLERLSEKFYDKQR